MSCNSVDGLLTTASWVLPPSLLRDEYVQGMAAAPNRQIRRTDFVAEYAGGIASSLRMQRLRRPAVQRFGRVESCYARRASDQVNIENAWLSSRLALGFTGMMLGLLVSTGLILCIAAGLVIAEVRWEKAAGYCSVAVMMTFGVAIALIRWGVIAQHPYPAHFIARIEAALEVGPQTADTPSANFFES